MPQNDARPSEFDAATAVHRAEAGGLVAELDPGWDVGGGILNGGYLLAVIARAAVLDSPHPHPVAVSASYLRAPAPGRRRSTVDAGPGGAHAGALVRRPRRRRRARRSSAQVTTATLGDDVPVYSRPDARRPAGGGVPLGASAGDLAPSGVQDVGLRHRGRHPAGPRDRRAGRAGGRRASR